MDITIIENTIEELENSDTTFENVSELAALYICRENLFHAFQSMSSGSESVLLPYYNRYIEIKKEYQLNKNTEGAVIQGIKDVCQEFIQFLDTLYNNTDMNKERRCIIEMIEKLNEKYHK